MKTFSYLCPCCGSSWSEDFERHVMEYDGEAISFCPECDKPCEPESDEE